MKVAVYYNNRDIRIEERPVPRIGPGEMLVRVKASGICGSDVMEWYRIGKAPLVLGHEIAGTVEETGEGVAGFSPGDRVFVSHHVPCNRCRYCEAGQHSLCETLRTTNFDPGGFAEYIRVPRINVTNGTFKLPGSMSFDEGAFIEPLACVLRGVRTARFRPGGSALVLGCGISGLLFVKVLRALGASRIAATDIVEGRLEAARRFGADAAYRAGDAEPGPLKEDNDGLLYDLVVVCAGAPSVFEQAFSLAGRGGTVLLFAPPEPGLELRLPLFRIWRDQIAILSTYAGCPEDIREAIDMIASKRVAVEDMITHRFPLEETAEGFRLVSEGIDSIKVIITP
ncbi:MAG TPA: alcohol dehydrogenase [Candidatus Eisenbacteria bacterium]|uniref:Alcohol dehydrogenase n=1 Tax=Eiseniibacteriota bacterium TaxID=2212470 RepID=A0A7V2AUT1_UNCEI|nr:alcohol dehydrogenase [Candidatus Eisenbacteria bacterium]